MDEFSYYGKELNGEETELELAQLARIAYLKKKMRKKLLKKIGDQDDNIADLTRSIILGLAIEHGNVTDEDIITRYETYIEEMLVSYGGYEDIMDVLEGNKAPIDELVVEGYYTTKRAILTETDIETIRTMDLPWEPVSEEEI